MKYPFVYFLFIFFPIFLAAQVEKGDRILAYQVDMAENMNYDSAFAYAQQGCIESIHLSITWSDIETEENDFSTAFLDQVLSVANLFYPAFGIQVELQIAPINTNVLTVPADLRDEDFNSQIMIDRFQVLLDTVFSRIPNLKLAALNIGNESDVYFGEDVTSYALYGIFLDSIIPYAKAKYWELHGEELKVGTTFTFEGLTTGLRESFCWHVNERTDIVSVTYYPLNSDFTVKAPEVVSDDFQELVTAYTNNPLPIYFAECGYPSSSICNSSEQKQAEFYREVFKAWDEQYDHIKYLTIFKTTDWSQATVDFLETYYGISDLAFKEYLRTLGVRTYPGNGQNKLALERIYCELQKRNFCNTECTLTSIHELDAIMPEVYVYPVPATNEVYLKGINKPINRITIYDHIGNQIKIIGGDQTITINELSSGIYWIKVELESGELRVAKIVRS